MWDDWDIVVVSELLVVVVGVPEDELGIDEDLEKELEEGPDGKTIEVLLIIVLETCNTSSCEFTWIPEMRLRAASWSQVCLKGC